jgi:hypothetical protein
MAILSLHSQSSTHIRFLNSIPHPDAGLLNSKSYQESGHDHPRSFSLIRRNNDNVGNGLLKMWMAATPLRFVPIFQICHQSDWLDSDNLVSSERSRFGDAYKCSAAHKIAYLSTCCDPILFCRQSNQMLRCTIVMMMTQGELVNTRRPCHSSHTMTRKKPKRFAVLRGTLDDAYREGALTNVVIHTLSRSSTS